MVSKGARPLGYEVADLRFCREGNQRSATGLAGCDPAVSRAAPALGGAPGGPGL